ncbi:N-acetyltransferase [Flammeovirga sp. EKP202]|uniref:GNAT family N-acetyltransferase n=1 Tax=Flammeovirga sp. EKP202 TaxID=2770592 RepID=UPI00165F3D41|nr:GNAT family N-acetyltransferase [Flammeovirga sp. EKP202]MBD0401560.1 GNAT family N-acetyltransferase [Flammeovirga sp. EKP202]
MNIEVTSEPSKDDLKTISKGIETYNQNFIPDEVVFEKDTKFAVFVKNDNGKVLGGIRACAFWNYCIIELLWISEEARGMGVGTQLMASAEEYAIDKGFEYMRTETLSFQARPFYEKQGYMVYGELKDYPKGQTTYCLVKKL